VEPPPSVGRRLTVEQEIAEFKRLKPRLEELWREIFPRDDGHYTSVVVPSVAPDPSEVRRPGWATYREETLLFLLIRLRNPRARMVYVTSQPIHPIVLDYYLQLLSGIPASHARARLTLLCAWDASPRPLSEKILERPRLIQRIRAAVWDPSRAYLTAFSATPLERRLAVLLDLPLNGADPGLAHLATRTGGRKVFREAGVELAPGREDVRTEGALVEALEELREERPEASGAVLKLDDSPVGRGLAFFRYPPQPGRSAIREAMQRLEFAGPGWTAETYLERYVATGGVVEEWLAWPEACEASAQVRSNPRGDVILTSTHDRLRRLAGNRGPAAAAFPADGRFRQLLQAAALRIGEVLARRGIVSRFSVDFLAGRPGPAGSWRVAALGLDLGLGGYTHPFLALRFLTGGRLETASGRFVSARGASKSYIAADGVSDEIYKGLLPDDLIEILTFNGLLYNERTETGVLFHSIGALSEFGRVGLVSIGNDRGDAEARYRDAFTVLEREATADRI
jgi:PGM1 C-terminal domain